MEIWDSKRHKMTKPCIEKSREERDGRGCRSVGRACTQWARVFPLCTGSLAETVTWIRCQIPNLLPFIKNPGKQRVGAGKQKYVMEKILPGPTIYWHRWMQTFFKPKDSFQSHSHNCRGLQFLWITNLKYTKEVYLGFDILLSHRMGQDKLHVKHIIFFSVEGI